MRTLTETIVANPALFTHGDRVLLGVSGGADSVAMTYLLHFLRDEFGIKLYLAHLHHGLRGADADADLNLVRNLAAHLNLPLITAYCDVAAMAEKCGVSVEMAARDARLSFFREQTRLLKADKLALAHNIDDQAETMILRFARGTGSRGLGGILAFRQLPGLVIIRPMLGITHAEAVAFLKAHGLRWREDISNNSDEHLRNRVRHKILPLMEELLNPNIRATLCRTAEILNEEEAWLNELAHEEFSNRLVDETCELKLDNFFSQATAMRRRILLLWLFHNQLPANILDFNTVCVLDKLSLSLDGTKRMSVGGGWSAVRRYARLGLERESSGNAPIEPMRLNVPGETFHSGLGITVLAKYYQGVIKESGKRIGEMPSTATISAVTVGNDEIFVRSWQAGDYMRSYGLGGSKKLQDIFTDQKIPADHRSFIPVFECRGDIIWIPGYRIATDWAVPDGDSPSLLMEVHRKELPA